MLWHLMNIIKELCILGKCFQFTPLKIHHQTENLSFDSIINIKVFSEGEMLINILVTHSHSHDVCDDKKEVKRKVINQDFPIYKIF